MGVDDVLVVCPHAFFAEQFNRTLHRHLPAKVYGSPRYHRQNSCQGRSRTNECGRVGRLRAQPRSILQRPAVVTEVENGWRTPFCPSITQFLPSVSSSW